VERTQEVLVLALLRRLSEGGTRSRQAPLRASGRSGTLAGMAALPNVPLPGDESTLSKLLIQASAAPAQPPPVAYERSVRTLLMRASAAGTQPPPAGVLAAAQSATDRLAGHRSWSEPASPSWVPTPGAVGPKPPRTAIRSAATAPEAEPQARLPRTRLGRPRARLVVSDRALYRAAAWATIFGVPVAVAGVVLTIILAH
jgi:hypothetical protein